MMTSGRLNPVPVFFRHHTTRNLSLMLHSISTFSAAELGLPEHHARDLRRILADVLDVRLGRVRTVTRRRLVVFPFRSRTLDSLGLGATLRSEGALSLIPRGLLRLIGPPLAAFKYSRTSGQQVFSYAKVARSPDTALDHALTSPCACCLPGLARWKDISHGHIVSAQFEVMRDFWETHRDQFPSYDPSHLINVLSLGTKFRAMGLDGDAEILGTIEDILFRFSREVEREFGVAEAMSAWYRHVVEAVTTRYNAVATGPPPSSPHCLDSSDFRFLRRFCEHFVISYMDKAANSFVFCCKKHYVSRMREELAPSRRTYEALHMSKDEALDALQADISRFNFPCPEKLAILAMIFKFHKIPSADRVLSCGAGIATAPLSIWLARGMKALMPRANALWAAEYARCDMVVSSSWILNSSDDVCHLIRRFNRSLTPRARERHILNLVTFDFKNMYTNIELGDLKTRMAAFFSEAFHNDPALQLKITSREEVTWVLDHTEGPHYHGPQDRRTIDYVVFSVGNMTEWFSYLIDHQYVQFGDRLFRQVYGIPMGTNCAVFVANLYLFTYELEFIRHLADTGNRELMRRLQFVGRFVDDLLGVDADILRDYLYIDGARRGVYPRGTLQLDETGAGPEVPYMDIQLYRGPEGIATDLYDKRLEPGFRRIKMIRFPHIESFISDSAKYNIVTSQLIRFSRLCSTKSSFVHRLADMLAALTLKQYNTARLFSKVRKLIYERFPDIYAVHSVHTLYRDIVRRTHTILRSCPPPF